MGGRPLSAASLAFVGGVAAGAWLPQEPDAWGTAGAVTLALWAVLLAAGRMSCAAGVGLLVFACTGVFHLQADLKPLYAGEEPVGEGDAVVSGRVARPPETRDGECLIHLEEVRLRRAGATARLDRPLQLMLPGGEAGIAFGDRLTARGQLRAIRGDRNLGWFPAPVAPRERRYASRLVVPSAAWIRSDGRDLGNGPTAAVLWWRAAADRFWKAHPGAEGAILNSLTTGERAGLPRSVQEAFQRSGLSHLLAISGMNVGFLAALVFLALRRSLALCEPLALRCPVQPVAAALTLPALWFFMIFSGSQAPVARAAASGVAGMAAVVLWRRLAAADALALAALALVVRDPRALFSPSFQLSFSAVGALLLVADRSAAPGGPAELRDGTPGRVRRAARSLLMVSVAASALTGPLVVFHFQQVSLVGPIANLVAVPFTELVVLPSGWLALAAQAFWAPAGAIAAAVACWPARLLVWLAEWFALPGWAALRTARPSPLFAICLTVLAAALLRRGSRARDWACCVACAAAAVAGTAWAVATHPAGLSVAFLDVGQGLAAAVRLPGGGSLLFDAGPRWREYDGGERVVVPALRRFGVCRLDTLVISHPHPDHAGGAAAVLRELGAGRVWLGYGRRTPSAGEELSAGGGARVRVVGPTEAAKNARGAEEANDRSLMLLISLGKSGVLLTGDAGQAAAAALPGALTRAPPHLALQVPHHGGSAETCRLLCATLRPEISVVSVGRNTYGHPRAGALAALAAAGRTLRTDQDGAVFVRSDGGGLEVRTWRELSRGRSWSERLRWLVAGW